MNKNNRRLLCLLLTLCMVVSLMPMSALAAPNNAEVPFQITSDGGAANEGTDYAWDSETNVLTIKTSGLTVSNLVPNTQIDAAININTGVTSLTLKGVNIKGATGDVDYGAAIFDADFALIGETANLTVTLEGDNTVAFSGNEPFGCGIFVRGKLTINGSGNLNATSNGTSTSYGVCVQDGELIVKTSGTIAATGNDGGIYGNRDVTINSGTVNATGGSAPTSYGIRGSYFGILSINGGDVTATGGDSTNKSYGIYGDHVTITAGKVTATGGSADANSYGIYGNKISITGGSGIAKTNSTTGENDDKHAAMNSEPKDSDSNPVLTNGTWDKKSASWPKTTTYTVTYNKNEGIGTVTGAVPEDNNSYASEATVTVLGNTGNLVKTDSNDSYTFVGWNTLTNGYGKDYKTGDTFTINKDTTLYAKWARNPKITGGTVSASANVGSPATIYVVASGTELTYQWQVSTDEGSTWNNVSDGTGSTSEEYKTVATTTSMNHYKYRCIVKSAAGGMTTSAPITLTVNPALHSHDISVSCGNDNPFTFTEWDGTGDFPGGYVYLSDDVVLSEDMTITGDVKLCLNGHKLSSEDGKNFTIFVGENDISSEMPGTLYICDCEKSGAIKANVNIRENGALYFHGGTIQNPMEDGYGIFNRGKLTVFGGKVVGSTGIAGYQYDNSELVIKGGEIVGTKFDGLFAGGDVEIHGGTINGQDCGVFIGNDGRVAFANAPIITGGIKVSRTLPDSADAAPIVTFIGDKSYTGANLKISLANKAKTAGYLVQGNSAGIGKFSLAEGALAGTTLEAKTEGETLKLIDNPAYTVTFDSRGGSAVASQTVNAGSKATEPTEPTKTGHTFDGWFKDESFTTGWDFDADTVTAAVTLYAKWTAIAHTHDWDEPTYAWNADNTACTATRICKTDSSHVETVKAVVTSSQTKAPTCTEKGETTYTAAFDVDWAEQQAMTDEISVTGHSFVNGKCAECGAADQNTADQNTESPKTGDNSNMMLWSMILLAAFAVIAGVALYGKKRTTKH